MIFVVDFQVNIANILLMSNTTKSLAPLIAHLSAEARRRGLSDSAWARLAGLRKESLSRLRRRDSCDYLTLDSLARAVGARLAVQQLPAKPTTSDGHFPLRLTRDDEEALLVLATSRDLQPENWTQLGPRFFMAGLATLLASLRGFDRRTLLALAETLHPGTSQPDVFRLWLKDSPLRASRFVPPLEARMRHAP